MQSIKDSRLEPLTYWLPGSGGAGAARARNGVRKEAIGSVNYTIDGCGSLDRSIFEYVDTDKDNVLTAEELIDFMHKDSKKFAYLGLNLIFLT